jgi:hypothetical protein
MTDYGLATEGELTFDFHAPWQKADKLEPSERTTLYEWTRKYIPTGLKKSPKFTSIDFDLTSPSEMQSQYGFGVSEQP